jgi:hypothetical protein
MAVDGLNPGDVLTGEQMQALFEMGLHPLAEQRQRQLLCAANSVWRIKADQRGRVRSDLELGRLGFVFLTAAAVKGAVLLGGVQIDELVVPEEMEVLTANNLHA